MMPILGTYIIGCSTPLVIQIVRMHHPDMFIDISHRKISQANPANSRSAATRYAIATTVFLDPNCASWTLLEPAIHCKFIIQAFLFFLIVLDVIFSAGHVSVVNPARRTTRHEARWTDETNTSPFWVRTVCLFAVGRFAISDFGRISLHIRRDCPFYQMLECG